MHTRLLPLNRLLQMCITEHGLLKMAIPVNKNIRLVLFFSYNKVCEVVLFIVIFVNLCFSIHREGIIVVLGVPHL